MSSIMEAVKENLLEIEIGSSPGSFQSYLDLQRELLHSQIDELQNVVVTQCRLTGVNPLSQEMAAGALSVKIGKRPRDLLNPKAVKYMQAVFSVKDAISKKESREISAQFGVTVTQVKDFFNSQRIRVRKLVRLSREKAIRSNAFKEPNDDGVQISSDTMLPIDPVPLNSVGPTSVMPIDPVPLNSIGPSSAEEAPSCSAQDDSLVGLDNSDKHFVENIFSLMRKEETFSGQVKLMQWILQTQNSSVLSWFITNGGVMILATWLSHAANEEQTSFLLVILKVLSYLPLLKAPPETMSAILQSVNKLRFYRGTDISNRARSLLSKWSRMCARSQASKKPNGVKSSTDVQNELILKQSIGQIMADETWQSGADVSEAYLTYPYEGSENFRKLESPQALKLLTASTDDSAKKNILGVSSSYNRERRKTQFVEQPGQKLPAKSSQVTRAAPVSQGRPLSADDIQKSKMRAQYMQSKYGKTGSTSNGSNEVKTEGLNKSTTTQASISPPVSKVYVQPKIEETKKPVIPPPKTPSRLEAPLDPKQTPKTPSRLEAPLDPKQKMDPKEPPLEKCKMVRIPWQTPPEVKLNVLWSVGGGDNSKEMAVQRNRIHRETETMYLRMEEIPSNPKEPWDIEMDSDDTLTPEIPTEQPPDVADADAGQIQTLVATDNNNAASASSMHIGNSNGNGNGSTSTSTTTEPDLELLAVLLKNPELVFALTSGQAGNLSSEDTVKLLDMIKTGVVGAGPGVAGNVNGFEEKMEEKVEVSLPSPTPSSNPPGTSGFGWRNEAPMGSKVTYTCPEVSASRSWVPAMNITIQQPPPLHNHAYAINSSSIIQQTQASEIHLTMKNHLPSPLSVGPNSMRIDHIGNANVSSMNAAVPERHPSVPFSSRPQQPPDHHHVASVYASRPGTGNLGPESDDTWRISNHQRLASDSRYQATTTITNQNNYNPSSFRQQPQLLSVSGHPQYEGNEYVGNSGFESWSPDNSPTRPPQPEYVSGRNFQESNMNTSWSHGPDPVRSRQPGYRDHNKHENRRWCDRRR